MKLITPMCLGTAKGADKASSMAFKNSLSGSLNDFQVLIREHLQNSSDAFHKSSKYDKLKFKVSRTQLDFSNTDLNGLLSLYKDYRDYTDVDHEKDAMTQAITNLENLKGKYSNIWVTRIEDNSGGLDGISTDERVGSGRILSEYITNKSSYGKGSKGSFGVGKITGFVLLNKTFTVFYYNRNEANGQDYIIGKVKIPTYRKKDQCLYGENAIIGKPDKDARGNEFSTWTLPDSSQQSFRSMEEYGLSTIIPQFENPTGKDEEWQYIIAYSIIHSFFKMFEKDELLVEIQDDFTIKNLLIDSKNYKEIFKEIGNTDFIKNPEFKKNQYDYLIAKPFVINDSKGRHKFDIELKVTSEYTGKAYLTLFENTELKDYFEENKKAIGNVSNQPKKTVRLLRDGMLLRESRYPNSTLPTCELSGYVEFDPKINEIIRAGENLRHDDFDERNLDSDQTGFPAQNTVYQKLVNPLRNFITESIDSIVRGEIDESEEYEVEMGFSGNYSENNKPSFKRRSALETFEIPVSVRNRAFTGKSGIPTDEYESGNIDEAVIIPIPEFEERRKPPYPPPPPPPDPPKEDTEEGASGSTSTGRKPKVLPELVFLTKLNKVLSARKELKEYHIRVENWINQGSDLILSQIGESRSSTMTLVLLEIYINERRHKKFEAVRKKNAISHYLIKDIPPNSSKTLILKLKVKESLWTEPNFSIKIKRQNP